MKKELVFLLIVLIVFIIVVSVIALSGNTDIDVQNEQALKAEIQTSHINLKDKLSNYSEYSINISYVHDNTIYGTVETDEYNQIIFSTVAVFIYDIDTEEIEIIPQSSEKRIMKFYANDEYLYYLYEFYDENDELQNEFKFCSRSNTNQIKSVSSGNIENPLGYPVVLTQDEESIYLVMKTDEENKAELYKLSGTKLAQIAQFEGKVDTYNSDSMKYVDNKIYYIAFEDNNRDCIKVFDMDTKNVETVFANDSEDYSISAFTVVDNKLIIDRDATDTANSLYSNTSNLITYNMDTHTIDSEMVTQSLYYPILIDSNYVLFYDIDANVLMIYDVMTGILKEINTQDMDVYSIYSNYYLLDSNKILVNDSDDFYVLSIDIAD